MHEYPNGTTPSLHTAQGGRKYLNAAERRRFTKAAWHAASDVRLFCLTLFFSGGRISEILALTPASIDFDSCVVTILTLKRREPGVMRQVPLPRSLVRDLERRFDIRRRQRDPDECGRRLWGWSRTTGWRRVKEVMAAANVSLTAAMPKGLRHGFGVNATANLVPQHLIQRWLGHASPKSTAIYCDVCGPDERGVAERMWESGYPGSVYRVFEWAASRWDTLSSIWRHRGGGHGDGMSARR